MYAKKLFSFNSKPFSHIPSSFSSFFSFFNVSPADSQENDHSDHTSAGKDHSFYQIHSQTLTEIDNSYEKWVGKTSNSHLLTNKLPCKITIMRNSLFWKLLGLKPMRRNSLENRVVSIQYAANNYIEDRLTFYQTKEIDGYLLNLFDGHGGWQLSEYAMESFPRKFQKYLSFYQETSQDFDDFLRNCFLKTFDAVEAGFLKIARKAKSLGLLRTGAVGSWALSVFVRDNKLFVANSGICKGFLCGLAKNGEVYSVKINKKSKKPEENPEKNAYFSNLFEPVRGFGDFSLKYSEFCEESAFVKENAARLTHLPEINVVSLNENDRFLILGTHEVWNYVKRRELQRVLSENFEDIHVICENIFGYALEQICLKNGIAKKEELLDLPVGKSRRKAHEDISLVVVDLKNQYKA